MNWRRGFNRLYLVCTFLWMAAAVGIMTENYNSRRYAHQRGVRDQLSRDREALRIAEENLATLRELQRKYPDGAAPKPPPRGVIAPGLTAQEMLVIIRRDDLWESDTQALQRAEFTTKLFEIRKQAVADTERNLELVKANNALVEVLKWPVLLETIGLMAIPPAALYPLLALVLATLRWLIRGFRSDNLPVG